MNDNNSVDDFSSIVVTPLISSNNSHQLDYLPKTKTKLRYIFHEKHEPRSDG